MSVEQNLPPTNINSPSARFQLYPSPIAPPGKCAICGAVNRPVVDFGMTIEFYGAVYFCETCLTEAARVIDMVPRAELLAAEEDSVSSFEKQLINREKIAVGYEQFESLAVAVRNIYDSILSISAKHLNVVAEQTEQADAGLFELNVGTKPTKPADSSSTDKSAREKYGLIINQGPFSFSDNTGDGTSS